MPRHFFVAFVVMLFGFTQGYVQAQTPLPPVNNAAFGPNPNHVPIANNAGFKSPNPDMHFTAGLPVRVLADGGDPLAYTVGDTGTPILELFVDDVSKGTTSQPKSNRDWNEFIVNDLSAGPHTLKLKFTCLKGAQGFSPPIQIVVDPPAVHSKTVNLTQDLVLNGAEDLNWSDATIVGNGFKVRSAANWTGSLIIRTSHVSGLGGLDATGVDVSTQNGSITIEDSVFEWTGAVFVKQSGTGALRVHHNEFRANCQIDLRPTNNPERAPIFKASGNPTGTKVFAANNVGYGFVAFEGMHDLLIGGDTDDEGNILIGPRCGFYLYGCHDVTMRGNYSTHNYQGGWSQGYNFKFENNCTNVLAEHNVIRGGSWPVQGFPGEFRYNLVPESGHDWVRGIGDKTSIHHNIFMRAGGGGGEVNEGLSMYKVGQNVNIYNNTFDCGGSLMNWPNPVLNIGADCSIASLRNNVITNVFPSVRPQTAITFVKAADGTIAYADYNDFWNPDTTHGTNYSAGAVKDKKVGDNGFGAHDLQVDPHFAQGIALPFPVQEGDIWNRKTGVSEVLAMFRARYTPAPGSPLIDAGDPSDGPRAYIGAVGAGAPRADDLFGTFGKHAATTQPGSTKTTAP